MRSFDAIYDIAAERKGGAEALEEKIGGGPVSPDELILKPGDRWLSTLTNCVFQAGFNWKVVDAMWDGFEEAFFGFDLGRVAMLHDEMFDALITNTATCVAASVRNPPPSPARTARRLSGET